jgi:hypothetical protein
VHATKISTSTEAVSAAPFSELKSTKDPKASPAADPDMLGLVKIAVLLAGSFIS